MNDIHEQLYKHYVEKALLEARLAAKDRAIRHLKIFGKFSDEADRRTFERLQDEMGILANFGEGSTDDDNAQD